MSLGCGFLHWEGERERERKKRRRRGVDQGMKTEVDNESKDKKELSDAGVDAIFCKRRRFIHQLLDTGSTLPLIMSTHIPAHTYTCVYMCLRMC